MRILLLLAVLLFAVNLNAATLTFQDTSGTEKGFLVYIMRASGQIEISWVSGEKTATGQVQLTVDGLSGDCFMVASGNMGGASAWSNRACLQFPIINPSNAPTGLDVK